MPVILASQEAEIRRIKDRSQPRQIVHETQSRKHPSQKRAGGMAQGVGPEFKPQYRKKKKEKVTLSEYMLAFGCNHLNNILINILSIS
jgi:hypothetical protein